jgi:hypothetical protein
MPAIRREDLLDCLRKLEQERRRCWEEADKRDLGSTVTHGYLGVGEIAARFGIEEEEIWGEPVEAKPEKKMAPSEVKETRGGMRKSS